MKKKKKFFYLIKYSVVIYLFLCINIFYIFSSANKIKLKPGSKNYIFTFWEPLAKIPGYISLCIKTWKKFLPDYDIYILDYKAVKNFLGFKLFRSIICRYMSFTLQADAIRIAILRKFGGIWMDADTIITNDNFILNLGNYELIMIGEKNSQHIGFIYASKNSTIINAWLIEILRRVNNVRNLYQSKNIIKKLKWNYLGNDIIDTLLKNNNTRKKFLRLNKNIINAFPEDKLVENSKLKRIDRYKSFYFRNGNPKKLLGIVKGIIMLHNSWTPKHFKNMSEEQFLKENILLSNLLRELLK